MDNQLIGTLHTLRDIDGIQGSFVVESASGRVIVRDIPSVIEDTALAQVGPRICRLLDVVEADDPTEASSLRFADYRLEVRKLGPATLCVMADARVNQPALRMAIKLVCRKLEAHDWTQTEEEPAPATSQSAGSASKSSYYRVYRGTRLPE